MSKHISEDALPITDPAKQPGVVLDVPSGIEAERLLDVGYYAVPMVKCSFCKKRTLHNWGSFAVLSDNAGLALCGRCCAEKIADKATVARIERKTEKMLVARKHDQAAKALLAGIDEIDAILTRDLLPVENRVVMVNHQLRQIFKLANGLPPLQKLAQARGGIARFREAVSGAASLSSEALEQSVRRRATARRLVREGIQELENAIDYIHPSNIARIAPSLAHYNQLHAVVVKSGVLTVSRWGWDDAGKHVILSESLKLPKLRMPDLAGLRLLVDE